MQKCREGLWAIRGLLEDKLSNMLHTSRNTLEAASVLWATDPQTLFAEMFPPQHPCHSTMSPLLRDLYPYNTRDLSPVHVPEGSVVFCFGFESLAPQSPEAIAEELWDQIPVLQPPVMV